MIDAGKYNRQITIFKIEVETDAAGFQHKKKTPVLTCYAEVKTTKGMTLITSGTDFERAYTRFTIRFPFMEITRDMQIDFRGKTYTIEYLNNVDEADVELEIQAREITH